MKFIKVIDSYAISESRYIEEFLEADNSFLIMVDDEYELLKEELETIIDNSEDYDGPYDEMMAIIAKHGAQVIAPDVELEW